MKTLLKILVLIMLISSGCTSVEKMIDQGDYDQALHKSMRRIVGENQLKGKYVLAIEEGFLKATTQDFANMKKLEATESANNWKQIIKIIERIDKRQITVQRFTPLVAQDGYQAAFEFVDVPVLLKEAITNFVHFRYSEALDLIKLARFGDKLAARTAFALLSEIWDFRSIYLDARTLQAKALDLGMNHISISIENTTGAFIPDELSDEILYQNFVDDPWIKYNYADDVSSDGKITILLNHLEISPERVGERSYAESKRIDDGFRYVLDENENVAKDSLGNDIKERTYKTVRAHVIQTQQSKSAVVFGKIIVENYSHDQVKEILFDSDVIFEHISMAFAGDPRALSTQTKELLESEIVPFPENNEMIYDLIKSLNSVIGNRISRKDLGV